MSPSRGLVLADAWPRPFSLGATAV
ncbi:uncharacterized protein G2W53_027201 [Senna tora]|uniref:Uncharacterized protein n=1 Tax=Senna tora TaxID=362788 RepID=A0A834TII0_9FABA|nr:uncharacterized protein G2W53_027201 [Senna tora]